MKNSESLLKRPLGLSYAGLGPFRLFGHPDGPESPYDSRKGFRSANDFDLAMRRIAERRLPYGRPVGKAANSPEGVLC